MTRERLQSTLAGLPVAIVALVLVLGGPLLLIVRGGRSPLDIWLAIGALILAGILFAGLFMVNPNEARVLQLFGAYVGTVKTDGLRWVNPLYTRKRFSLRVRSFETQRMKVNDSDGNPIEIASVITWRVTDTFAAMFHVEKYEQFVQSQAEIAVRDLASRFPYDVHDDAQVSLRGDAAAVASHLLNAIQDYVRQAGVEVVLARISHLAYAPEIAHAMLQRQQANAVIGARQRIVEGAVGMVEMALDSLSRNNVVQLDEERKAAMVSNLLVVLCGDRSTQPIVNTGSLYT